MTLIDLAALESACWQTEPFRYAAYHEAFTSAETAQRLSRAFPESGFSLASKEPEHSDKPYRMWHRTLIEKGADAPHPLPAESAIWQQFACEILHPDYRAVLERACGQPLQGLPMEATFWRYDADCWLSPHLDKREKAVTQLFYFNEAWDPNWGGDLLILASADKERAVRRLPPLLNTSVILPRSDASWHAVDPVVNRAAAGRLSVQVVFYRA